MAERKAATGARPRVKAKSAKTVKPTQTAKPAAGPRAKAKARATAARPKTRAARAGGAAARPSKAELLAHLKRDLSVARDVFVDEVDQTVAAARRRFGKGGSDRERVERVRKELQRGVDRAADRFQKVEQEMRGRVADASERLRSDERVQGAAEAGLGALSAFAGTIRSFAERVEQSLDAARTHAAGTPSEPGVYTCLACGATLRIDTAARLPLCGGCGAGRFKR